ncbi:MAG: hypothetical protein F4W93_04695 [Dehalococcoidia bacterium]|nr:hypothetical protein [Dehalococcoidia bacterium]
MKRCPSCKGQVAQNAGSCPNCGHDFGMETAASCFGMTCLVITVCVILILLVLAVDAIL